MKATIELPDSVLWGRVALRLVALRDAIAAGATGTVTHRTGREWTVRLEGEPELVRPFITAAMSLIHRYSQP